MTTSPLLRVRNLNVTFNMKSKSPLPWAKSVPLRAVSDVSFDMIPGETLGIVGESGSGKSTLARAIIGTLPTASGEIIWDGTDLAPLSKARRQKYRKDMQMVFQDPLAALNPRMTVGEIIAEPLRTHRPDLGRDQVRRQVSEMMERVGLLPNLLNRYPHEFSGGQCQRIGIARALIMKPRLVVCDEPVSALDVSVQAQVVNLLMGLQKEMGLSLIFIAHDLSVVKHISTRIAVVYLGRMMELAPSKTLIGTPQHPYTKALVASVPIPDPKAEKARKRDVLEGELPSPLAPPSGCVFRTRCPVAEAGCAKEIPAFRQIGDERHLACDVIASAQAE